MREKQEERTLMHLFNNAFNGFITGYISVRNTFMKNPHLSVY